MANTLAGVEQFVSLGTASVTAGGTTAPLAGTVETWTLSGSSLPAASSAAGTGFYMADTLQPSEVILVTNISGVTATVVRGADGTTPVAHVPAFTVIQIAAGATFRALQLPWIVRPSGDTSGATDGAAIMAAYTAGFKRVQLLSGTYWWPPSTVILDANSQQFLAGFGDQATFINITGGTAGPGITLKNTGGVLNGVSQRCGLRDLSVDGTSAPTGSIGIQAGDSTRMALIDLQVTNFTGTGAAGYRLLNNTFFTEQLYGRIRARNCTNLVTFDVGAGTGSFVRPDLTIFADTLAGQNAVNFTGANANIAGGRLQILGNMNDSAGTGVCLKFTGAGANIGFGCNINIQVESDNATAGPQTINFGATSNTILDCYGALSFSAGGGGHAWQQSNRSISVNQFRFSGPVSGDATLQATPYYGRWGQGAIANAATIVTQTGVVQVTPAAAVTGIILAAGNADGQQVTVINNSAFTITFDVSGTSHVADGTSDVIPAATARTFTWSAGSSLWYRAA